MDHLSTDTSAIDARARHPSLLFHPPYFPLFVIYLFIRCVLLLSFIALSSFLSRLYLFFYFFFTGEATNWQRAIYSKRERLNSHEKFLFNLSSSFHLDAKVSKNSYRENFHPGRRVWSNSRRERDTSWWKRWLNWMNYASNCFPTHRTLQIWSPATTGFLQTSKRCSRERDLAQMKKRLPKLRPILRAKANRCLKKRIEKLEERWNECITLEGEYVDE